jgi:uncharacterized protein
MSTLKARIQEDMKTSLRSQDKQRLGAIRLILAAIKQREVDERIVLDDSQITAILDKMLKQRRDSLSQYQQGGRQDLADQESFEINIIQEYLPTALTEAEIDLSINQAITATSSHTLQDIGKVMAHLKPMLQGRADMSAVSAKIKKRLSET